MKKCLIKIHPLSILFLLICFFCGYFRYVFYMMSLIFIHEIGHVSAGMYYGWKVKKIVILPIGGITYFEDVINKPLKEEAIILIMGPIYQILFYNILIKLGFNNSILYNVNMFLLIVTFLPIIPLDGSKLINLILNVLISFRKSINILFYISIFFIIIFLYFFYNNLIMLIFLLFLFYKSICYFNKRNYIFNKFLFERFLYKSKFKKIKVIDNIKKMKRDYFHLIKINDKIIDEDEFLYNLYR